MFKKNFLLGTIWERYVKLYESSEKKCSADLDVEYNPTIK